MGRLVSANPIKDLGAFFDAQYQEHVGTRYPFNNGKDAKLIKDLRAIYSDDDIRTFMAAFFEIEDEFIEHAGYSIGVFRGCLPKVIAFISRGQKRDVPKNLTGIASWMQKRAGHE